MCRESIKQIWLECMSFHTDKFENERFSIVRFSKLMPMKDRVVLQALPSNAKANRKPKFAYVQIEDSKQGKVSVV